MTVFVIFRRAQTLQNQALQQVAVAGASAASTTWRMWAAVYSRVVFDRITTGVEQLMLEVPISVQSQHDGTNLPSLKGL